jgi:hypothetical protein
MENKYLNLIGMFFVIINTLLLIPSALGFAVFWAISIYSFALFKFTLEGFIFTFYAFLSIISFPFIVYSLVMFMKLLLGKLTEKKAKTVLFLTIIFHFLIGLFITLLLVFENAKSSQTFELYYLLLPLTTIYLSTMGYFLAEPDTPQLEE